MVCCVQESNLTPKDKKDAHMAPCMEYSRWDDFHEWVSCASGVVGRTAETKSAPAICFPSYTKVPMMRSSVFSFEACRIGQSTSEGLHMRDAFLSSRSIFPSHVLLTPRHSGSPYVTVGRITVRYIVLSTCHCRHLRR